MDINYYDHDRVLALAESLDPDNPPLTMAPLRRQLADGGVRSFDDLLGLIIHLGCRAGRSGFDVAAELLQSLLAIPDLNDAEIAILRDVVYTLGSDNE